MRPARWALPLVLLALPTAATAKAPVAKQVGHVELRGKLYEADEISDAVVRGQWMVVVAAEGNRVQILQRLGPGVFEGSKERTLALAQKEKTELDLEGAAWGERYVYVVGSHSKRRDKVGAGAKAHRRTAAENVARLEGVSDAPDRRTLCRFQIDGAGKPIAASLARISLYEVLKELKPLSRFRRIPGKENGIDIEGLAANGDEQLFLGFRGPILRGNFVPVLVLDIAAGFQAAREGTELRYVDLGGRGIRELHRMKTGRFLVLAGPMGDGPGSHQLYLWNGKSCVPGRDKPAARANVRLLCTVPAPRNAPTARPEGLCVLEERGDVVRVLVTYDGVRRGAPTVFECRLPTSASR